MFQRFESPSVRAILGGILIFLLFAALVGGMADVVKWTGEVVLFLPARLGMLRQVQPYEVARLAPSSNPYQVRFTTPGRYMVFTQDLDLLTISDDLSRSQGNPWVVVRPQGAETPVDSALFERGLRYYDTPHARGRPVIYFDIPAAGLYDLRRPSRPGDIFIVPDYTSGNEGVIYFSTLAELGLLGAAGTWLAGKRRSRLRQRIREVEGLKRMNSEDFWKTLRGQKMD